mgnify:CR=1 FL=1
MGFAHFGTNISINGVNKINFAINSNNTDHSLLQGRKPFYYPAATLIVSDK